MQHRDKFVFPQFEGEALLQVHCHQKSVHGEKSEQDILESLGLSVSVPESGCCGMAGAFGFESQHAGLSEQIGAVRLIPAVKEADKKTLVIADGFSCRQQISQSTDRKALHLAEILKLALTNGKLKDYSERLLAGEPAFALTTVETSLAVVCLALVLFFTFAFLHMLG